VLLPEQSTNSEAMSGDHGHLEETIETTDPGVSAHDVLKLGNFFLITSLRFPQVNGISAVHHRLSIESTPVLTNQCVKASVANH